MTVRMPRRVSKPLRGAADTDSADTSVFIVLRTPESFEGLADIQIEAVYADQDLAKAHCVANPSLRYEEAPISRRLPADIARATLLDRNRVLDATELADVMRRGKREIDGAP